MAYSFSKEELKQEINNGLCIHQISKKYHCTHSYVAKNIKKFGLKIKKAQSGGHNYKQMIGNTYGSLVVIEDAGSNNRGLKLWKCKCVCGKERVFTGSDLRQGKIKTCGCRNGIISRTNWQGYKDINKSHWSSIVTQAKYRKIEFDITIEYAWSIFIKQNKKCALTGENIILTPLKNKTASLDRIDNNKGYIKGNIQWVHKDINKLKGKFSIDELINLCHKVSKYNV